MDATQAKTIVASLTVSDMLKVYSGKPGCACGCNGNYRITQENRKEAEVDTGYAYADEDVNPRQVKKVLKQVQLASEIDPYAEDINATDRAEVCWNVADDLQYVTATVNSNRVYTVYLTSAARRARGITEGFSLR